MKKRELLQDDFLTDLMKKTSLESPSDDFTRNLMGRVEAMPAYQPHKKPFFEMMKSALPWILLVGVFVMFYISSDLPFGKYIPGSQFMRDVISPSVSTFFSSFKDLASNKFYLISLVVIICGIGLFVIERLITHRISSNRHYLI